ncbi:MAG: hypothetical protein JRI23_21955, partial [Deltaproteobacteria bacterium]|nr:hypothetical protein [Deltaproteobacteria bacterium]MBW2534623.1 hypothetical protein [Deltaproteobacteria bacterium]
IIRGKPDLAAEQASHLLAADPADTDSRLSAAAAADLMGNAARVIELCELPPDPLPPSPAARALLAELLRRHVGPEAAREWSAAAAARWGNPPTDEEPDALLDALLQRSAPSERQPR